MHLLRATLFGWAILTFSLLSAAQAQQETPNVTPPPAPAPAPVAPVAVEDLPPELEAWVPWVLSSHPDLACPLGGSARACVWPGELQVDARSDGARFRLKVHTDRATTIVLPGGPGSWPDDVRVDGRPPSAVIPAKGRPTVAVPAGTHTLAGALLYGRRPASLPLAPRTAMVRLTLDGVAVPFPRIDSDGLRLGSTVEDARRGEHLDVEVNRRIRDGVPLVVETVLALRASGRGREVDFGRVTLEGTRPVSLKATLPARFTPEGTLQVQVRPGTYELRFEAVHDGAVDTLKRPPPTDSWPAVETWAVQTDDRVRAVNLSGPVGIDPARTTLPEAWRTLPAFSVPTDTPLSFETLRRGDPDPAPNQLSLDRSVWVDFDGQGLTIRDRFSGTLHQGWRLDAVPPAVLGHASAHQQDLVITTGDAGQSGIELRREDVSIVAESRVDQRGGPLPAVGWDTDVVSLAATLHLPPGFRLFAATGVDSVTGSMVNRWTLFDLFFVLVLAMATFRLLGWQWGLAALVGLALARHEANAPQWMWAVMLSLVALRRAVTEGWGARLLRAMHIVAAIILVIILVPFAVTHLQSSVFPALERPWQGGPNTFQSIEYEDASRSSAYDDAPAEPKQRVAKKAWLGKQVDPQAVVQTGPGVPTWQWKEAQLSWSGPVARSQEMRLTLLGPTTNLVLAVLRVFLLGGLFLRLINAWPTRQTATAVASALVATALLLPSAPALAGPDPELLDTLEKRLTLPPACSPDCVSVSRASLTVGPSGLRYRATVHAAVDASWPVPGPASVWVPSQVRRDGRPTHDLARMKDGMLHVRVPAGAHVVEVEGPLPPVDAVGLAFGEVPQFLEWSGDEWAIEGHRADGTVDASVQLTRMLGATSTAQSTENLSPWLEVQRHLDLGIPWRVRTTVSRIGPTDYPVAVKVPLLPGEAVTEGGFDTIDNQVAVSLDRDERSVSWLSTLALDDRIELTAPTGVPWTEVWTLSCSPVYACAPEGPAPLQHVEDGQWTPQWRVWPGESLVIGVQRPPGIEGQTTTIDDATLTWTPGRRQLMAELALTIRSSQGGRQTLTLPEGAELQKVDLDGAARPLQLRDGRVLQVPLRPGAQKVSVAWQQPKPAGISDRMPAVDLGGPAVNLSVIVQPARNRWIAALFGPRWGPVPLMWTYVVAVLVLAPLLARARFSPLASWQWGLLGLGMTQVPFAAPVVVGWFFGLAWRKEQPVENRNLFNLAQLGLLGLTLIAMVSLYAAIHTGLLWQPDMQVSGAGSNDGRLVWMVDRVASAMPRPTVVSFPLWSWRVVMLGWSLWLAASLVRWLPWAFRAWTDGGWIRQPDLSPRTDTGATPSEGPSAPPA